ncbi:hypothetical protein Tco_0750575 [Tanacetum coccineum]|uniref:Uncharacterized protein n=1 Tax=Tanacetum coccineum TaxID=301880 RepID=A0ABQ4Z1N2_9ASTR
MANISNYGSDVISEVPHSETYLNDMENQSVHAMQDFEQTPAVDFTDNEIHSDSNIILYSQYLQETQQENVQDTNLQAQQDSMILSVIEQMSEQMINHVFVITSLKNNLLKLKGKEIVDIAAQTPSAYTIVPGMFKLDLEPLAPMLLQNMETHINYLKYTQEQADILRGIVEQAKATQPLDKELDFAYTHAQRIQELLVYVRDTCPNAIKLNEKKVAVTPKNKVKKVRFAEPLTSSSNIKQVESSTTSDSNTPMLSPAGLKCSTSNYESELIGTDKSKITRKQSKASKPGHENQKSSKRSQRSKALANFLLQGPILHFLKVIYNLKERKER